MQLHLSSINVAKFTCTAASKLFVAEHSDLKGEASLQQRLYDDACDVGFALYNPRTHALTRWAHSKDVVDERENELLCTIFVPTPETLRKYPGLLGWEIHVLND